MSKKVALYSCHYLSKMVDNFHFETVGLLITFSINYSVQDPITW